MTLEAQPFNIPFRIFLLTLILSLFGVVFVYSSSASYAARQQRNSIAKQYGPEVLENDHAYHSEKYAVKQGLWFIMGLVALFGAYLFDYSKLKTLAPFFLVVSLVLLILVFVPGVQRSINDHRRWIGFGPITVQPSEFAKLALILYMARMINNHYDKMQRFVRGVLPALALTGLFALLIVAEPDIGATAVLTSIVFLMWFIGGMRIVHLLGMVVATIPAFIFVVLQHPDRVRRILAFLFPSEENSLAEGFQLQQSLIAVGSGGLFGTGLGQSIQKHFLNEQFSDFIFAIVAEELGFVGASLIILCFFLLIWEGYRVAKNAPDFHASLLAAGITLMLAINVVVNLMVVLGLAPTKGLVLPFLSAGGSNLIVMMTSMGILMNIGGFIERENVAAYGERERKRKRPAAVRAKPRRRFRRREA